MLWRSARKTLTVRQTLVASEHYDRLLKRWAGNLNPSRCARLWANARCLALHPERFTFNSNQTLKNFRLERLLRWTGILLAAACTWTGRYYINADVISYLDVADAYLRSDWQHAINGHWSPLYSWILATILWIWRADTRPSSELRPESLDWHFLSAFLFHRPGPDRGPVWERALRPPPTHVEYACCAVWKAGCASPCRRSSFPPHRARNN